MACNQNQIKKFPWTAERVAALFEEAKTDFLAKGSTPAETLDGLSARHGIKREIIADGLKKVPDILKSQKDARRLTDEMWLRQQNKRVLEQSARHMITEMNRSQWSKTADNIANAPRRVVLAGHFGAFTKSHLSEQAFYNPMEYARNFQRSWGLITKHGRAMHEQRLAETFTDTDPDYVLAKRAGLDVKPGGGEGGYFAKETKEATGQKSPAKKTAMAFDELRMTRFRIFKKELQRLSPEERADIDQVKGLADVLNHDTGTVQQRSGITRWLFLSPRLLPAQVAHTFVDIPKALIKTGLGFRYGEAAPAMRYVARKTAILASAYTAIMAANKGLYLATGDKRFDPNLIAPGRTDWLRLKLGGHSVPISPSIELIKLPVQMMAAAHSVRTGQSALAEALLRGMQSVLGRQNPLWALVEESLFGEEPGTGRPTPFPGLVNTPKGGPTKPKLTYTEFLGSKLPIPVSNLIHEVYDEMRSSGLSHSDSKSWAQALALSIPEAITSYHAAKVREDFGFPTKVISKGEPGYQQYKAQQSMAMLKYKKFKEQEARKPQPKELFGL